MVVVKEGKKGMVVVRKEGKNGGIAFKSKV